MVVIKTQLTRPRFLTLKLFVRTTDTTSTYHLAWKCLTIFSNPWKFPYALRFHQVRNHLNGLESVLSQPPPLRCLQCSFRQCLPSKFALRIVCKPQIIQYWLRLKRRHSNDRYHSVLSCLCTFLNHGGLKLTTTNPNLKNFLSWDPFTEWWSRSGIVVYCLKWKGPLGSGVIRIQV